MTDVSDVHHIVNVVAKVVGQNPPQNVEGNVRSVEGDGKSKDKILMVMWRPPDNQPGMPHVGGIVDGGSAAVPRYIVPIQRHELLLLPGEAVEQLKFRPICRFGSLPRRLPTFRHCLCVV